MRKHLQSLAVIAWLAVVKTMAQNADPAVTSAAFAPTSTAIGQTSELTVNFSNAGTTAIPAGSIEVTISAPYVYYSNGGTPFPTGAGAGLFTWTYLGSDTWRGVNINSIAAATGGTITITVKGLSVTTAPELTNINVQPVNSFASFNDSPNNNNIQAELSVLADTDGDGIPDNTDTDDDNDGILDTQDKFPLDTDNDGTPNATDTDDDGDGIADTAEAPGKALDTDNDGQPNVTDTDDDNDGIPDSTEQGILDGSGKFTLPDSDGDGLPDLADPAAKADLFGNYTFGSITFAAADTKTVIININEINGGATNGIVEFFVPSMAGFTVIFNSTQTSATVIANETVNNSDWEMTDTGTGMKFTSKAGIVIPANGRSRVALTIKADTAGTTANLTTNITPSSGGDSVTTNNVAVLAMSIQN